MKRGVTRWMIYIFLSKQIYALINLTDLRHDLHNLFMYHLTNKIYQENVAVVHQGGKGYKLPSQIVYIFIRVRAIVKVFWISQSMRKRSNPSSLSSDNQG